MPTTLHSAKSLFILEEGITYLNCANMSPMLIAARDAGLEALETRAAPWKISTADWFTNAEKLRTLAAGIFQTASDNVCIIPSASYGLAAAAKNIKLPAGKEIIVLEQQFPSNYYIWDKIASEQQLKIITIDKPKGKHLTESILEKISSNTGLIAIPNCHWIDGAWIDLQQISDASKKAGSFLVLDLSQSLGVLPINIEKVDPDFAVSVGYKWLLGPYGLSYMYVSKKWQEIGEPLEYSWITRKGSEDFTSLTGFTTEYRTGARKFDMGEVSQFNLLPMAIAGLSQLLAWEISAIHSEIKKLTDRIIDYRDKNFDGCPISAGHIVSIPLNTIQVPELKTRLQNNKIFISFRGSSIRISPHLYNSNVDVDKLFSCL